MIDFNTSFHEYANMSEFQYIAILSYNLQFLKA